MDIFEEHQLFIPIINDGRFAERLRVLADPKTRPQFNKVAYDALYIIRRENNLSLSMKQVENVQQALWDYFQQINKATSLTPPKEEPTMAKTPAFETKHFVDGQDATTITDEGLIHAIRRLETEIEALSEIKTKSNKITIKIEELNKQREAIAALLDSRP